MNAQPAIDTAHGRLDSVALAKARDNYDTTALLRTVDELTELLGDILGEEGWRDRLLRLHGMAHTIINGTGLSGATGETLPELASDITGQMYEAIERLQSWIKRIEPLEKRR